MSRAKVCPRLAARITMLFVTNQPASSKPHYSRYLICREIFRSLVALAAAPSLVASDYTSGVESEAYRHGVVPMPHVFQS